MIWTRDPRHQIASRRNARWQTDWAIEEQAKNLNSTARPYDQRAFSALDLTVSWLSHLVLAIYIFVVVNFDALAQANDIQIERRQVVFLCREQDLNPGSFSVCLVRAVIVIFCVYAIGLHTILSFLVRTQNMVVIWDVFVICYKYARQEYTS